MATPKTPEEYRALVQRKLNFLEQSTGHVTSLDERLDISNLLLMEIAGLLGGGVEPPTVQAWPNNAEMAFISSKVLTTASTAYQMSDFTVPSGFVSVFKSWPDNSGVIYVAFNEVDCVEKTLSWPLMPGEFVGWQLKNTNAVYASSTAAGDRLVVTVERRQS